MNLLIIEIVSSRRPCFPLSNPTAAALTAVTGSRPCACEHDLLQLPAPIESHLGGVQAPPRTEPLLTGYGTPAKPVRNLDVRAGAQICRCARPAGVPPFATRCDTSPPGEHLARLLPGPDALLFTAEVEAARAHPSGHRLRNAGHDSWCLRLHLPRSAPRCQHAASTARGTPTKELMVRLGIRPPGQLSWATAEGYSPQLHTNGGSR